MRLQLASVALLSFAGLHAGSPLQPVDVKTTAAADYAPGATVRVEGTAGELDIETWDQPRVEATLVRTEYADARERDTVQKRLEKIALAVEKQGGDITVRLETPRRNFLMRWLRGKTNATLECRVMVPKDAKLLVRHQDGSVLVYGSGADIDASVRFGDLTLQLADPGQYALDAKVRVGGVYTDYAGRYRTRVLVGQKFESEGGANAHKVRLRVATGGIEIVKMTPEPAAGL